MAIFWLENLGVVRSDLVETYKVETSVNNFKTIVLGLDLKMLLSRIILKYQSLSAPVKIFT